jgi:hypothetical protein
MLITVERILDPADHGDAFAAQCRRSRGEREQVDAVEGKPVRRYPACGGVGAHDGAAGLRLAGTDFLTMPSLSRLSEKETPRTA